ncbi:hypothetical protein BDW69DRAFT_190725, partial [Aspergillus filifer]
MVEAFPPVVLQLCDLLQTPNLPAQLASAIQGANSRHEALYLRIDASLVNGSQQEKPGAVFNLKCIDLRNGAIVTPGGCIPTPASSPDGQRSEYDQAQPELVLDSTPTPTPDSDECRPTKRHKTVGGLQLPRSYLQKQGASIKPIQTGSADTSGSNQASKSIRQFESDTRFPQRAKPGAGLKPPTLEPTSTDRLIAGIWKQIYSSVHLSRDFSDTKPSFNIRSAPSLEVFKSVNALCLRYYNRSQSSRALEMVVQAFWVECFEARTAVLRYEKPILSKTESRMIAIREACVVLGWKEKDLRNRMAIWRGYKEIKDYGGWAALVFASAGVYRFCKYRSEFGQELFSRLRRIRSSLEVAADTLHLGWRDLLRVVQQDIPTVYNGHPHSWVITDDDAALPLASTYEHLNLPDGFRYTFIDDCILDEKAFGTKDPRRAQDIDAEICYLCHERQSDNVTENNCMCFPTVFGGEKGHVPVQIFRTSNGKNNGVVARC